MEGRAHGASALDRACGHALYKIVLNKAEDDDHRDGGQHGGGHDGVPADVVGGDEAGNAHGESAHLVVHHDDGGIEKLVPGHGEGEDTAGKYAGKCQRQNYLRQRLIGGGSVHHGGLLKGLGDGPEGGHQHPEHEGRHQREVGRHDAGVAVDEADLAEDHVEGQKQQHRRNDVAEEHGDEHRSLARVVEAHEAVGGQHADEKGNHRGQCGDDKAVEQKAGDVAGGDDVNVGLKGKGFGKELGRNGEKLLGGPDGGYHHPVDGEHHRDRKNYEPCIVQNL